MGARVLFVHGALGEARVWDPVIAALPDGLSGEALTLTYFGDADWPDDGAGFSTATHAADIVRAAAGGGVTLVSWSMGTHPALQALLDAPDLFDAALFYEPGGASFIDDADDLAAWQRAFTDGFGPITPALEEGGDAAAADVLLGMGRDKLSAERLAIYRANARTMTLLLGGGQPPARIRAADCARIPHRTQVMAGDGTGRMFAIGSRALAAALPGANLRIVAGADHFLPETDPARFAALVAEFSSAAK